MKVSGKVPLRIKIVRLLPLPQIKLKKVNAETHSGVKLAATYTALKAFCKKHPGIDPKLRTDLAFLADSLKIEIMRDMELLSAISFFGKSLKNMIVGLSFSKEKIKQRRNQTLTVINSIKEHPFYRMNANLKRALDLALVYFEDSLS